MRAAQHTTRIRYYTRVKRTDSGDDYYYGYCCGSELARVSGVRPAFVSTRFIFRTCTALDPRDCPRTRSRRSSAVARERKSRPSRSATYGCAGLALYTYCVMFLRGRSGQLGEKILKKRRALSPESRLPRPPTPSRLNIKPYAIRYSVVIRTARVGEFSAMVPAIPGTGSKSTCEIYILK